MNVSNKFKLVIHVHVLMFLLYLALAYLAFLVHEVSSFAVGGWGNVCVVVVGREGKGLKGKGRGPGRAYVDGGPKKKKYLKNSFVQDNAICIETDCCMIRECRAGFVCITFSIHNLRKPIRNADTERTTCTPNKYMYIVCISLVQ